jgi:hypothetical protein
VAGKSVGLSKNKKWITIWLHITTHYT